MTLAYFFRSQDRSKLIKDEDNAETKVGEGNGETHKDQTALLETLSTSCPNWSPEFSKRYSEQCSYWIGRFTEWEQNVDNSNKEVAYTCENESECRGWGDRLGGLHNAFLKALNGKHQFRIGHENLRDLFSPCLFSNKKMNWAASPKNYHPPAGSCITTTTLQCYGWITLQCAGHAMVTANTDRTCIPDNMCIGVKKSLGEDEPLSVSNVIGCGLRAMLEPGEGLLNKIQLPLRLGAQPKQMKSVREIEDILKQYYIISIHFRLGDGFAFYHKAGEFTMDSSESYQRPFHCAATVESYLGERDASTGEIMVDGRPVRWLLASDSYRLKRQAMEAFGDKVIFLDIRPEHVAIETNKDGLFSTIAEWYLIGLGDQMVVNKIGTTSGDFFHGRVSAFPKTSWAYQLKHIVYDAGTCRAYSIPFEGIWEDLKGKTCGKSSWTAKGKDAIPQHHLKLLHEQRLDFPSAYVVNGKEIRTANVTKGPVKPE